jgi:hypothetical protein
VRGPGLSCCRTIRGCRSCGDCQGTCRRWLGHVLVSRSESSMENVPPPFVLMVNSKCAFVDCSSLSTHHTHILSSRSETHTIVCSAHFIPLIDRRYPLTFVLFLRIPMLNAKALVIAAIRLRSAIKPQGLHSVAQFPKLVDLSGFR